MTVLEALDRLREAGSIRVENGQLKVKFPPSERAGLEPALAVLRVNREAAIGLLTRAAEAAPLDPDDPPVWLAFPYRGDKGLEAWIRRMEQQRDWHRRHGGRPEKPSFFD